MDTSGDNQLIRQALRIRRDKRRSSRRPYYIASLLIIAVLVCWYDWMYLGDRLADGTLGVALDDGWIHLVFARNVASGGGWAFNAGQPSAGDSSILWVLLLAFGFLLSDNGPMIAHVWNVIALMVLALLICRTAFELTENNDFARRPGCRWTLLILLVTICCGNLLWYALTGMETLLILVVGLGAITAAGANRRWLTACLVLAAALVRPEGITVGLAIGAWHYQFGRFRVARPGQSGLWSLALIAGAVGLTVNVLWQFHLCGRFLPSTLLGRSWIVGCPPNATLNPLSVLGNFVHLVAVWAYRLLQFSFGQATLVTLGVPAVVAWTVAAIAAIVAVVGFVVYFVRMRACTGVLLFWSILHLFAYAVVLPTRGHAGRYQPMVLLVAMLSFGTGAVYLVRRLIAAKGFRIPARLLSVGASVLVVIVIGSTWLWRGIADQAMAHFDRVHVAAAHWVKANTPDNARVAAFDIGAMGYYGRREIIDISGLLDPAAGRALYDETIVDYLRRRHVDYLAMIFPYTDPPRYFRQLHVDRLADNGQLTLKATFTHAVPDGYLPGEAARLLANTIRIYGVTWP